MTSQTESSTADAGHSTEHVGGRVAGRLCGVLRLDVLLVGVLVALVVWLEIRLRVGPTRPLWYDELWRAYYVSRPLGGLWHDLSRANAPTSFGWLVVERAFGDLFGWRAVVLRMPQLITLPLLAVAGYALVRRFTGPVVAFLAGGLLAVSGTVLDLGAQFKPYTMEAIASVVVLALWSWSSTQGSSSRGRVGRRLAAASVTLLAVPFLFLIGALAAADVLLAGPRLRGRVRAALEATPALLFTATHTLVFVAHQSQQHNGPYWNGQFVASRSISGVLVFICDQLVALAGAAPPGIDRTDVNLVHGITDGTPVETWVLAPAFVIVFVLGARVLLRRTDGRYALIAVLGTELLQLAASADRYWPFGPTRTNLFLVPFLLLPPAVGAADLAFSSWRRRRAVLGFGAAVLLGYTGVAYWSAESATIELGRNQYGMRLIDQTGPATVLVRRLARSGDLVVVVGRLARPGWLYEMEVSDDGPAGLRRVPQRETVFVNSSGDGTVTRVLRERRGTGQVIVFVQSLEGQRASPELRELRAAGWCRRGQRVFPVTGEVLLLRSCAAT